MARPETARPWRERAGPSIHRFEMIACDGVALAGTN
jgi:hypothetical protein